MNQWIKYILICGLIPPFSSPLSASAQTTVYPEVEIQVIDKPEKPPKKEKPKKKKVAQTNTKDKDSQKKDQQKKINFTELEQRVALLESQAQSSPKQEHSQYGKVLANLSGSLLYGEKK